jgi:signal transduction histidine kinase
MALRRCLDHVGLVAALRQHVESVAEKNNLLVSFSAGKAVERLPANVETVIYRVVQEALTNAVRYAHATRVDVVLTVRESKLIVIVEDDGIGFEPEAVASGEHLGLFGMRERAEMIDGKLAIESSPGKGTTILLEVSYALRLVIVMITDFAAGLIALERRDRCRWSERRTMSTVLSLTVGVVRVVLMIVCRMPAPQADQAFIRIQV